MQATPESPVAEDYVTLVKRASLSISSEWWPWPPRQRIRARRLQRERQRVGLQLVRRRTRSFRRGGEHDTHIMKRRRYCWVCVGEQGSKCMPAGSSRHWQRKNEGKIPCVVKRGGGRGMPAINYCADVEQAWLLSHSTRPPRYPSIRTDAKRRRPTLHTISLAGKVPCLFGATPYFPAKGRVGRNPSFGHLGLTGENHKNN